MVCAGDSRCPEKWGHGDTGRDLCSRAPFVSMRKDKKGDHMDNALRGAVRACHSGLDSLTLRRELAERLMPALGMDAHAFSMCDPGTGLPTHTLAAHVP